MMNKGRCSDGEMMVAMRAMDRAMAKGSFELRSLHIDTKSNVPGDTLSRIAKHPREWDVFVDHAREHFGLGPEALHRVEVKLDVAAELRKLVASG